MTCNRRSGSRPRFSTTGRVESLLPAIPAEGLSKGARLHVHPTKNVVSAIGLGARRGTPFILKVEAGRLHRDGRESFLSGNDVWLTESVPPSYLTVT